MVSKIFIALVCASRIAFAATMQEALKEYGIKVEGTSDLSRVTLVRNEQNHLQWEPMAKAFAKTFTDESPNNGVNRYYLRVEQADGNMAWSSPVWVRVK